MKTMKTDLIPPYRMPECTGWTIVPEGMLAQSGSLQEFVELEDYLLS